MTTVHPIVLDEVLQTTHDLCVGCVGYESRSRHLLQTARLAGEKKCAFVFENNRVLDFQKNMEAFRQGGYMSLPANDVGINQFLELAKSGHRDIFERRQLSILIDISSMSRLLMASICFKLMILSKALDSTITVDFVYSLAAFGKLPKATGPLVNDGPVIDELAGWPSNPGAPCALVMGIGYEEDLALSVLEQLEAAKIWVFRPKDHALEYDLAIDERNKGLFEEIPSESIIRYSIFDPYWLYVSIESLVGLSLPSYNVIVVPLGPKIFALMSMLASLRHYPSVGFWRISCGDNLQPVDRKATSHVICSRVVFDSRT